MADPDFGTDVSCTDDLDPYFTLVSGRLALAQACYRRLTTRRGSLPFHPEYGLDLRSYLSQALTPAKIFEINSAIAAELRKDERITRAIVRTTSVEQAASFVCRIELVTAKGPFKFTIRADQVTVALLLDNAA